MLWQEHFLKKLHYITTLQMKIISGLVEMLQNLSAANDEKLDERLPPQAENLKLISMKNKFYVRTSNKITLVYISKTR